MYTFLVLVFNGYVLLIWSEYLYATSVNALNFMIILEFLSSNFEFIHHYVIF